MDNNNFKEVFERMATRYAEYVCNKVCVKVEAQLESKTAPDNGAITDSTNYEAIDLMNEVRTVNVIATTLTRMNANKREEYGMYSMN